MGRFSRFRCAAMLAGACLATACASLEARHDWWAVRASGSGAQLQLESLSHVNHGKPPRTAPVEPRLLREVSRGNVSIAVRHDGAIAETWSGSAWKLGRELDKALGWLQRIAGPGGARIVVTLVDDGASFDMARSHPARPPVVDLYVATDADATSQSAVVGRARATALHEMVHALAAARGSARTNRFAEEYRASLVQSCYLLDTLRPDDVLALQLAARHAPTDNYAISQSRAAAGAVIRELRTVAHVDIVRPEDATALTALRARCRRA